MGNRHRFPSAFADEINCKMVVVPHKQTYLSEQHFCYMVQLRSCTEQKPLIAFSECQEKFDKTWITWYFQIFFLPVFLNTKCKFRDVTTWNLCVAIYLFVPLVRQFQSTCHKMYNTNSISYFIVGPKASWWAETKVIWWCVLPGRHRNIFSYSGL